MSIAIEGATAATPIQPGSRWRLALVFPPLEGTLASPFMGSWEDRVARWQKKATAEAAAGVVGAVSPYDSIPRDDRLGKAVVDTIALAGVRGTVGDLAKWADTLVWGMDAARVIAIAPGESGEAGRLARTAILNNTRIPGTLPAELFGETEGTGTDTDSGLLDKTGDALLSILKAIGPPLLLILLAGLAVVSFTRSAGSKVWK